MLGIKRWKNRKDGYGYRDEELVKIVFTSVIVMMDYMLMNMVYVPVRSVNVNRR